MKYQAESEKLILFPPAPQKTTQVAVHTQKQSSNVKNAVPDGIPVGDGGYLNEDERVYPQCEELMREIGTKVQEVFKLVPAKAVLCRDLYTPMPAKTSRKNDISTPIVKALKDPAEIPSGDHYPPHDIEIRNGQPAVPAGAGLSRQAISNRMLRAIEDHLLPVYEELPRRLVMYSTPMRPPSRCSTSLRKGPSQELYVIVPVWPG